MPEASPLRANSGSHPDAHCPDCPFAEAENRRLREALEQLRHLVVSPGDMGREEIRVEGRRVIEEALGG